MQGRFAVVDLFAGPGGLAEGFSSFSTEDQARPFKIALSVEKEKPAHSTLLLRSFLRQFHNGYRANIVAYAIGKTAHDVAKLNLSIGFEKVWKLQALSPNFIRA